MTTRERTLTVALLCFTVVAAVGFFGYQLILAPLRAKEGQVAALQRDLDERMLRIATIQKRKPDLERWQRESLPADIDLARRAYEEQLSKVLPASGFDSGSYSIIPKPVDTKTVPAMPGTKKPIYSRLQFAVQAKGELASLVDFLERFYKLPLLHQIRELRVQRPVTADSRGIAAANDLDITMTIEALVLDTAENRTTLLPAKTDDIPPELSPAGRQYASIAGKNVFFGPPPVIRDTGPRSLDVTPHVKLDAITGNGSGLTATLWDAIRNHDYLIRPHSTGGFRVVVSYYINGRKRELRSGRDLEVLDDNGEVEHSWQVVRIGNRDLVLRQGEKYYQLRVGQTLDEIKSLSKDELGKLGIKAGAAPSQTGEESVKDR